MFDRLPNPDGRLFKLSWEIVALSDALEALRTTLVVLPLVLKVTSISLVEPSKLCVCAYDLMIEEATCSCISGGMVSKALTIFSGQSLSQQQN